MKIAPLLFTVTVGAIFAQQTKPIISTSRFYDVEDKNDRAFVEFSRNSTQKLFQAILKEEPAIRLASLSVRLYGGNPAPPGRYRLVVIREGYALPNTDLLATLAPKVTGMSYDDYMNKATSLRKITGQTMRRRVASTNGDKPANIAAGDILRVDLMKISPDRASDYYAMEQNDWLPLHTQRVKVGLLKSWSVWAVVPCCVVNLFSKRVRIPDGPDADLFEGRACCINVGAATWPVVRIAAFPVKSRLAG
jgi:hypothetical protein